MMVFCEREKKLQQQKKSFGCFLFQFFACESYSNKGDGHSANLPRVPANVLPSARCLPKNKDQLRVA